jgi:hypothetical protein
VKSWNKLDLSFNKLSGTLHDVLWNTSSMLRLQVNRLSGDIPSSLRTLEDISVLKSNIFACDFNRNSLPIHDPYIEKYNCGSDPFNVAAYLGVATCFFFVVSLLVFKFFFQFYDMRVIKVCTKFILELRNLLQKYNVENESHYESKFIRFGNALNNLRWLYTYLSLYIIILLMLEFGILSMFYPRYQYGYSWVVSVAFLSGKAPAIIVFISFIVFIILLTLLLLQHSQYMKKLNKLGPNERATSINDDTVGSKMVYLKFSLLITINCAIIFAVNIAYVFLVLNAKQNYVTLAQILLGFYKSMWNNVVNPTMFRLFKMNILKNQALRADYDQVINNKTDFSWLETLFYYIIIIFNNIVTPLLVTFIVNSSCFYYVLFSPPTITSVLTL